MEIGNINHGMNMYGGFYKRGMDSKKQREVCDSRTEQYFSPNKEKELEDDKKKVEESTTDTYIVVKPDGSRVLVMTTHIGGMSATVSMKLSEPTKMPNESKEIDVAEEEKEHVRGWNEGAGDLTAGPERSSTHTGGV